MYDKELYGKILDMTISEEDLRNLDLCTMQYDCDNSFEKYYDYQKINSIINKYNLSEIKDRYLAMWADTYNHILIATYYKEIDGPAFLYDKKNILICEISDWLDALSFFEEDAGYDLDNFNRVFKEYDKFYKKVEDIDMFFTTENEECINKDDIMLLIIDKKRKKYAEIFSDLYFEMLDNLCIKSLAGEMFENKVLLLNESRYTRIELGDDTDISE